MSHHRLTGRLVSMAGRVGISAAFVTCLSVTVPSRIEATGNEEFPPPQGGSYSVSCVNQSNCPMGKKWLVTFDWDDPECREVHVWFDFNCDDGQPPTPGESWACEPSGQFLGCETFTEEFCLDGDWKTIYDGFGEPKPDCVQFWLEWRGYHDDEGGAPVPYTIAWTEIDECYCDQQQCFSF